MNVPQDTTADRWIGVGRSLNRDPASAAQIAVMQAVSGRADLQLIVAFCSLDYDLRALSRALTEAAAGATVIGCTTAGEITDIGPSDATVVVTAFGGPGFTIEPFVVENIGADMRMAGREAAGQIGLFHDRRHRVLLTLTDALAGDQQELIRGLYDTLGPGTPVVGGCAGDDLKMQATYQFIGDRLMTNAIVGAAIGSDAPFGVGVRHGWESVGRPMLVTRSTPTEVLQIDGRPALDVYLDELDAPTDARTDNDAFTRFALEHPLGIARRADEPCARFIASADFAARSLHTIAVVPEGSYVWPMRGDTTSVADATDLACRTAVTGLDGPPIGLLVFDCVGRRQVLGSAGIRDEIDRIAKYSGGAPVAGFYTYGEIGRTTGMDGFHNETMVVLAVA